MWVPHPSKTKTSDLDTPMALENCSAKSISGPAAKENPVKSEALSESCVSNNATQAL